MNIRLGMVAGLAALATLVPSGLAATNSPAPVHRDPLSVKGAVNVIVTLPAGQHGGCREATRLWPDGVIGSPVNVRQHGRTISTGGIASKTWDASGAWCTYQAPVRLPAKYGSFRVAPASLPWRHAVALYGILTYEVQL